MSLDLDAIEQRANAAAQAGPDWEGYQARTARDLDRIDLIAEVRRLRAQVQAVRDLHARNKHGDCATCGMQANHLGYPCPTIEALGGDR